MRSLFRSTIGLVMASGLFLATNVAQAQGINFFKGTFEEAKTEALKQDKVIFVDAYTVWCGPCKRMAKNVFPNAEVGAFYNKHFVNLKVDCEKGLGRKFCKTYNVTGYPTLFFIDGEGNVVHRLLGGRGVNDFIKEGRKALNGGPSLLKVMKGKYEAGERSSSFLFEYANALNSADEDYNLAFAEYLATQSMEEKTSMKNIELIFDLTKDVRSPGYIYMMQIEDKIIERKSLTAYQAKLTSISKKSVLDAAETSDEVLFDNAQNLLKDKAIPNYKMNQLQNSMSYYEAVGDWKSFSKTSTKYVKTFGAENEKDLNHIAWQFYENLDSKKHTKKAVNWSAKAVSLNDNFNNNNTYAHALYKLGDYANAQVIAEKAIQLGKQSRVNYRVTQDLLRRIKMDAKAAEPS